MNIVRKIMLSCVATVVSSIAQAGYYEWDRAKFYENENHPHTFECVPDHVNGEYTLPISAYHANHTIDGVAYPTTHIITAVRIGALKNEHQMTSLTIPENYKIFGAEAFSWCEKLESVTFLGTDDFESTRMFSSCVSLKEVVLPSGLRQISSQMFQNCSALETIDIPQGVTNIAGNAFSGCSSLKTLQLPRDLTTIDDNAFKDCTSLTQVEIPAGVTLINPRAFYDCTNLKELKFTGDAPTVKSTMSKVFATLPSNGCVALVPEGASGYEVDKNGKWAGIPIQRYSLGSWDAVTESTTIEDVPGLSTTDKSALTKAGVSASAIAAWAKGKGGVTYGIGAINLNAFLMNAANDATSFEIDEELLSAVFGANPNHSIFKTRFPNAKVSILEVNEGALHCDDNAKFYRLKLELPQ